MGLHLYPQWRSWGQSPPKHGGSTMGMQHGWSPKGRLHGTSAMGPRRLHGRSPAQPYCSGKSMAKLHMEGPFKWTAFSSFHSEELTREVSFSRAAAASSSAPLGGFGTEYPEELQRTSTKKKTSRIADNNEDEVEDPTLLADADSCFCEFNGVQLHHKICDPELPASAPLSEGQTLQPSNSAKSANYPMILLHGFGASVFSWDRVMKPLAQTTEAKVLAFDRPAFGLSSRVSAIKHSRDSRHLNPFSMRFSMLACLFFIDFLSTEKAILVGHSAGALVALDAYFEAPERIAALILVAPAILAPLIQNVVKENPAEFDDQLQQNNLFSKLLSILLKFSKLVADAIMSLVKGMSTMISSLYRNALSAILRSSFGVMVIRMIINKFGISAVRSAWYDSNQVSDHVVQGYTKPLKVKGWDKALVEYTVSILTEIGSEMKPPLAKRLREISCPVLIVTGDTDRLVPAWNSRRVSHAIPGSLFEVIRNCGHLPQEEKPEEFVSIVNKFLRTISSGAEEHHQQTAF